MILINISNGSVVVLWYSNTVCLPQKIVLDHLLWRQTNSLRNNRFLWATEHHQFLILFLLYHTTIIVTAAVFVTRYTLKLDVIMHIEMNYDSILKDRKNTKKNKTKQKKQEELCPYKHSQFLDHILIHNSIMCIKMWSITRKITLKPEGMVIHPYLISYVSYQHRH